VYTGTVFLAFASVNWKIFSVRYGSIGNRSLPEHCFMKTGHPTITFLSPNSIKSPVKSDYQGTSRVSIRDSARMCLTGNTGGVQYIQDDVSNIKYPGMKRDSVKSSFLPLITCPNMWLPLIYRYGTGCRFKEDPWRIFFIRIWIFIFICIRIWILNPDFETFYRLLWALYCITGYRYRYLTYTPCKVPGTLLSVQYIQILRITVFGCFQN